MEFTAEILCLGNELLIGRTINTNANYLAKKLTMIGFKITRITTIRDEEEIAVSTIQDILSRNPDILLISGGLGPTHDDIQLQVVSKAVDRPLVIDEDALELIRPKYEKMNASREKMAFLPEGSQPLVNSQGSAPGVLTKVEQTMIFSLPGVPREMKAIFSEEIVPLLRSEYIFDEEMKEFGIDIRGARESDISEITAATMKEFDDVSFKSHPKKDELGFFLSLHTYAITTDEDRVRAALEKWVTNINKHYPLKHLTEIEPILK